MRPLPAMLPLPHVLPRTANGLLNIGRERRHCALVCAFIVEGQVPSQLLFGYDLTPSELSFGLCCRFGDE